LKLTQLLSEVVEIIADDRIPFLKGVLEPYARVSYVNGMDIVQSTVQQADALITRTRTCCNELLLHDSNVQFIASATIGFDHIDTSYCDSRSIAWTNAPGCNAASVQQYLASVLAHISTLGDYSLEGKTLGIIGAGHVGKKAEVLAQIFGMRVLLNDPPRAVAEGSDGFVSLEKLMAESDLITLHVPLSRAGDYPTYHLIGEDLIGLARQGSWLINTSRGEVIEGSVLEYGMSSGRLSGVVLDVWENEPFIDLGLLQRVNIATPHIAGYSIDGKVNATVQVVRSLASHFGLPLTGWQPAAIPAPPQPLITLDCLGLSTENAVCRAILSTYNVVDDDLSFRVDPSKFEKLRSDYPMRREFPAFEITMLNGTSEIHEKLRDLGFRVNKL
jgi:erythronate-4-phosphate dehydrogenase